MPPPGDALLFGLPEEGTGNLSCDRAKAGESPQVGVDSLPSGCEPSPDSADLLVENLAANGVEDVTVLPVAVTGARVPAALLDGPGVPPVLRRAVPLAGGAPVGSRVVKAVLLQDLLGRPGMERCDLLKLDCEGAESEMRLGTPPEARARVARIALEYHSEEDGRATGALLQRLSSLGFRVRVVESPLRRDQGHIHAWKAKAGR